MFRIDTRISGSRIGNDGKLKLSSAIDLLQDSSQLWFGSEPELKSCLEENNCGIFLISRQVDVIRRPDFGDNVSVITSIFECNRFSGHRNTVIYDETGIPCILSWSMGVFVDLNSNIITRLPQTIKDGIVIDEKADMEYLPSKIQLPDIKPETLSKVAIRRADIDQYNHVNNARYVETALEFLPDDKKIKRVRVEYKKAAKLGEFFYPELIKSENIYYITLNDKDGNPYVIIEFTA